MECLGCGRCCYLQVKLSWQDDVPEEMTYVVEEGVLDAVFMKQHSNGRCVALDANNECMIYDNRPLECRQFEKDSCGFLFDGSFVV